MTIREAIELVDRLKPNQYGSADKLRWLSELDGVVWHEIWSAHETVVPAFAGYGPETDLDGTALLIGWPYDEIYRWYLEMKIDDANGEMTKYNNSAAKERDGAGDRGRAGDFGEGCTVLGAEPGALYQRRFHGGVYAVRIHFGGGKAAHFHGRVSVHLPGWDLLQHREVFRQRVHGAGECGRRIEHERGNFSLPRRRDGADGEL